MTVVKNFTKVFYSKNICQRLCLVDSYRIFAIYQKTALKLASEKKKIKILLLSISKMTMVKNFTKVIHCKNICRRLCLVSSYRIFAIYQKIALKSARSRKVL